MEPASIPEAGQGAGALDHRLNVDQAFFPQTESCVRDNWFGLDPAASSPSNDTLLALFDAGLSTMEPVHASVRPMGVAPSASPSTGSSVTTYAEELIRTLHGHYYEALDSAHGVTPGTWETPLVSSSHHEPDAGSEAHVHADMSISSFFFESQRLEDAIGPLGPDDALSRADMNLAAAPEILQLFAPPEHQAIAAARKRVAPPPLMRREHHTLAIDSPLHDFSATVSNHYEA